MVRQTLFASGWNPVSNPLFSSGIVEAFIAFSVNRFKYPSNVGISLVRVLNETSEEAVELYEISGKTGADARKTKR